MQSHQARIQKILNLGAQHYKLSGWTGAQIYFFVLHIRANRGRSPGAPPLDPRLVIPTYYVGVFKIKHKHNSFNLQRQSWTQFWIIVHIISTSVTLFIALYIATQYNKDTFTIINADNLEPVAPIKNNIEQYRVELEMLIYLLI